MVQSQNKELEKTERLDKDLQQLKGQMGQQQKDIQSLVSQNKGMVSSGEVKSGEKVHTLQSQIIKLELSQKQMTE
jgi:hypothetical protein